MLRKYPQGRLSLTPKPSLNILLDLCVVRDEMSHRNKHHTAFTIVFAALMLVAPETMQYVAINLNISNVFAVWWKQFSFYFRAHPSSDTPHVSSVCCRTRDHLFYIPTYHPFPFELCWLAHICEPCKPIKYLEKVSVRTWDVLGCGKLSPFTKDAQNSLVSRGTFLVLIVTG